MVFPEITEWNLTLPYPIGRSQELPFIPTRDPAPVEIGQAPPDGQEQNGPAEESFGPWWRMRLIGWHDAISVRTAGNGHKG
jgi:hypothetical protein